MAAAAAPTSDPETAIGERDDATADADERAVERVLLAGASGGTGRRALERLAASGLAVRALTSSPEKVDRLGQRGADEVAVGDLLEPGTAERAVEGCDAVITAVGTRPVDVYRGGPLVDGEGNANLARAAATADVASFVMVSAIGVGPEPPGPLGRLFRLSVGPTISAKEHAEAAIRESGLRHTILRPGVLSPIAWPGNAVAADAGEGLWGPVPRDDVARLAVAAPFTPDAANRTLEVVRNPFLRDRAVGIDWRRP